MPEFLKSTAARVLTLVLVAHAVLFYSLSHGEAVPLARPLAQFPTEVGPWQMTHEGVIEQEIRDQLRADDYLMRDYRSSASAATANLYVAFFRTQRTGQTPHSPKNCLPGTGWQPSSSAIVAVPVPGEAEPVRVNQYIVSKGPYKDVVMYWYQSHGRVMASEYTAKFWVIADALRYNRTDTALVRVVVPLEGNEETAVHEADDFVRSVFGPLKQLLPS
jgi:EpsI family protein